MRLIAAGLIAGLVVAPARATPPPAAMIGATAQVVPSAPEGMAPASGSPMIELVKRCPNLRYVGRDAEFKIVVSNKGQGPARNVVVTDTMSGSDFVSADNGGQRQGDRVVWTIGTLDAGQSRELGVKVRCSRIGMVKNMAQVTYCAEAAAECDFEVRGIPAVLLECVDDPDPIEVGGTLTYTITVTNQGSQTATNVAINCVVPPELEYVSGGGATTASADGKNVRFAPLASLPPKGQARFTVTVKGVRDGDARFRVSMMIDQINSPVEETESTHVY